MGKNPEKNYYEILDVSVSASQKEIEKAYKITKKALSENSLAVYSLFDTNETKNMLQKVEKAYVILSSLDAKMKYDREIMGVKKEPASGGSVLGADIGKDYRSMDSSQKKASKSVHNKKSIEIEAVFGMDSVSNKKSSKKKEADDETYVVDKNFEEEIKKTIQFSAEMLKKIREYRRISVAKVANITKINPEYIQAIEDFNLPKLPPRVYLVGFLKQYSKVLNLDSKLVSSSYVKIVEESKKG